MSNETLFTLSVDDGHPADMRMAELLQRHGIAATFYIPVRNREGYKVLDATQLRELASQFEIGSHTLDHCFLRDMQADEAHHQIVAGKNKLEDLLGQPVAGFCYPGGKFGERDVQMVRSAGFRYARTTGNLHLDGGSDPYRMPTTCQFYPHSRQVWLRNFASQGRFSERTELLRVALAHKDWIDRINAMFDHACEHGGVFHLWCHSRDLEELDAWEQMSAFLARVAGRLPPAQRVDNGRLATLSY